MTPSILLAAAGENTLNDIFNFELAASFIWTLLIFGVSLPLLWKFVFKPIMQAMEEREVKVRAAAEAAEKARSETETMRVSIQQELENARQEASRGLAEAKRRAAAREQELMAAAQAEAEKERNRARAEIDQAVRSARELLRREAVTLAVQIGERVIQREFSAADQQRLLSEFEKQASGKN
jgi:F-type H+-transporting ATPase subunit b